MRSSSLKNFLSNPNISSTNKKNIQKFTKRLESLDIGVERIRKYIYTFNTLLGRIAPGFELATATEKELIKLSETIKTKVEKEWTQRDYHIVVRKYYKVMEGRGVRLPEKCDFFKPPRITNHENKDIITREEVKNILKACVNARDRAIIMMAYEGGFRIQELMNMNVKDVKIIDDGVHIHVPGKKGSKTGARDVWLVECMGRVREWLEAHPNRKPNSPLFVDIKKHKNRRMEQGAARTMFYKKARLAGYNSSKFNPHNYRHTCATEKASLGFSESQLNQFMGWRQSSKMGATYIHLTGKDVKEAYKRVLGMSSDEPIKVKVCPKCGYENTWRSTDCGRCFTILDPKKRMELVKKREYLKEVENKSIDKLAKEIEKLKKQINGEK